MRIEEFYRKRNQRSSGDLPVSSLEDRQHLNHHPQNHQSAFRNESSSLDDYCKPTAEPSGNSYLSRYLSLLHGSKATASTNKTTDSGVEDEIIGSAGSGEMDEESLLHTSSTAQNFQDLTDLMNSNSALQEISPPSSTTVIRFRRIEPKDRVQIQALHEEWFPVEYQQDFYDDLCLHQRMCHSGHALYTMVAVISKRDKNDIATSETPPPLSASTSTSSTSSPPPAQRDKDEIDTSDEQIIACLVGCVLSAHKLNATSRQLLVPDWPHRHSKLFYIMTLGTVNEYRHLGLATQLVNQVIDSVVQRHTDMGTIYLHVITVNDAAIRFYEDKLGFWRVQEIVDYYTIDGNPYNCYLYARYFHGNRGHLDVFKVVSRWISTLWSSVSYLIKSRGYYR